MTDTRREKPVLEPAGINQRRLLFVVGPPRSGTTLLLRLINAHPNISLFFESDFLGHLPRLPIRRTPARWLDYFTLWNDRCTEFTCGQLAGSTQRMDCVEAADALYRNREPGQPLVYCGEKSPAYRDELSRLAKFYPEARFILTWRDPRAVWDSVVRARQTDPTQFDESLLFTKLFSSLDNYLIQWRALQLSEPGRLFSIGYLDLVENWRSRLPELWDWLELPHPDPKLLESSGSAERPRGLRDVSIHSNLGGEIRVIPHSKAEVDPATGSLIEGYCNYWAQRHRVLELEGLDTGRGRPLSAPRRICLATIKVYTDAICSLRRILYLVIDRRCVEGWRSLKAWMRRKKRA